MFCSGSLFILFMMTENVKYWVIFNNYGDMSDKLVSQLARLQGSRFIHCSHRKLSAKKLVAVAICVSCQLSKVELKSSSTLLAVLVQHQVISRPKGVLHSYCNLFLHKD